MQLPKVRFGQDTPPSAKSAMSSLVATVIKIFVLHLFQKTALSHWIKVESRLQ